MLTNLVRLPPGKESFIAHSHAVEEEFIFVLEGTGEVTLDGEAHAVGPGDFVGFPTDGVVHGFRNTGASDLLYLTAGNGRGWRSPKCPASARPRSSVPGGSRCSETAASRN
uniref:Cupin domain-containing protein n=1 Tax=Phenylobacterium glaciei TaxID=2803784 RepID=A0A974P555_9CAUL|nr:cupin domain-containing protein [Phenylobacterium glaciei]